MLDKTYVEFKSFVMGSIKAIVARRPTIGDVLLLHISIFYNLCVKFAVVLFKMLKSE